MLSSRPAARVGVISLVVGVLLWLVWLGGLFVEGFDRDVDGNVLGVDHSIFHTAGKLVLDGDAELLYTVDGFNEALTEVRGRRANKATPHYLNPPGVAYAFAPLSQLPRVAGWIGLGFVGIAAMIGGLRLVGVTSLWATALVVMSLPGWMNFRLGQLAPLWALVFAAVYRLLRDDRQAAAGAVSGLLALKPQFGIVVAVWWALDLTKYRVALAWSAVSAAAITVLTFAVTPGAVSGFYEAAFGAVTDAKFPIGFSLNDTVLGLFPDVAELPVALAVAAAGVAALWIVVRRHRGDLPLQFAAAIVAALWVTPHLIAYDWMLVGVAAGALWADREGQRSAWLGYGALTALWAAAAWLLAQVGREWLDLRLELAAVGLAAIAVAAYLTLAATNSTSSRTITPDV